MIANALFIPTEQPPALRDIKRALLSFDTVHLTSPDDRELIPPNAYHMVSTGMPPIFAIPVAAVRPLGKVETYETKFEQTLDVASEAISQGILNISSAPVYEQRATIGAVLMPDGIPNPRLTYLAYRSLAANPEMIAAVSRGLERISPISLDDADTLAPAGAEDGNVQLFINGQEAHPPFSIKAAYPGFVTTEDERSVMTRLCHARLGALAKSLLICEKDALVPYTSDVGMASVIQALDCNTGNALDNLIEDVSEREILKRLDWLQRVIVAEFIDPVTFDELSVRDVLKLRTKAWGKAGEARQALNRHLKKIALENPRFDEFRNACRSQLNDYQKARADLDHELGQFRLKAMGEVGMGAVKTLSAAGAAEMIHKFLSTGSPEIALVLGGIYFFFKFTKEQATQYLDYMKKKEGLKESSGYALSQPYSPFIQ